MRNKDIQLSTKVVELRNKANALQKSHNSLILAMDVQTENARHIKVVHSEDPINIGEFEQNWQVNEELLEEMVQMK